MADVTGRCILGRSILNETVAINRCDHQTIKNNGQPTKQQREGGAPGVNFERIGD